MNEQEPISPRRRQQELLAIPERLRTDAQWDELNELEITLAAANRAETHEPVARRNAPASAGKPRSAGPSRPAGQPRSGGQPRPGAGEQGKRPPKKFHKRPPKEPTP
ncbi:hypothetical protein [Sulfuricella sp. T08]|uniref:hypothetical protein n=1 Tax=Sulfuricella sp. T08 TaxID=1632857 RepID=UPI0007509554|nr:hypothetical protein [Sulfuricella sp. T08]